LLAAFTAFAGKGLEAFAEQFFRSWRHSAAPIVNDWP